MPKKIYLLSVLSGFLVAFSYIPFSPALGIVALIPLMLAWDLAGSYKQIMKASWLSQFFISLIGFHWIAITAHDFGYMPWWLSILVLIAFCAFVHIHFCFAGALWFFLKKKYSLNNTESDLLKIVCLFATQSLWPMIFPWNLGYSWIQVELPFKQTAELWGFVGISFLVLLANFALKAAYENFQRRQIGKSLKIISVVLGVFLALNLLGISLKSSLPKPTNSLQILVVQANIGNFEKVQAEYGYNFQRQIIKEYIELTNEALQKHPETELIVWPETAIPIPMDDPQGSWDIYQQIVNAVRGWNKSLLSGSFLNSGGVYNAAVLLGTKGNLIASYKKNHLLAFGETVPFTDPFPKFQNWLKQNVPALSFFQRGTDSTPLVFKDTALGVNICYEGIQDLFISKQSNQNVDISINLTNDSWFGQTFEPFQHMYMTLARSIENRVPMLRSTNTGISTAMLADGTQLESSPMGKKWFGLYKIDYLKEKNPSLFQRIGNYVVFILIVSSLVVVFYLKKKRS